MDRKDGRVKWKREARVGFRHHAIISSEDVVYVVDGLSENAVEFKARRGQAPDEPSRGIALDLENGEEIWSSDSNVFGTFLLYSREHNILLLCIFLSSTSWNPRVVIGAKYRAACYSILCNLFTHRSVYRNAGSGPNCKTGSYPKDETVYHSLLYTRRFKHFSTHLFFLNNCLF